MAQRHPSDEQSSTPFYGHRSCGSEPHPPCNTWRSDRRGTSSGRTMIVPRRPFAKVTSSETFSGFDFFRRLCRPALRLNRAEHFLLAVPLKCGGYPRAGAAAGLWQDEIPVEAIGDDMLFQEAPVSCPAIDALPDWIRPSH